MRAHHELRRAVVAALILSAAALGLAVRLAAQPAATAPLERFTAFATDVSTAGPLSHSGSGEVEITIDRWSAPEEREALVRAFKEKGAKALLAALQKSPRVGAVKTERRTFDLHYAYQEPSEDGGRRIVLATDRKISFWETSNQARSVDYPFTLIEIRLDKNGKQGQGRVSVATKIAPSKDGTHIELENYASETGSLKDVRKQE